MRFNALTLFLLVTSGVLSQAQQQTAEPTSGTPDVTFPADDAFVFCSDQNCQGTCEVVDTSTLITTPGYGEYPPNDMGFLSIYWYDPDDYNWTLYTSVNYYSSSESVSIGPNTCYNLYLNGDPTYYYYYYYELN